MLRFWKLNNGHRLKKLESTVVAANRTVFAVKPQRNYQSRNQWIGMYSYLVGTKGTDHYKFVPSVQREKSNLDTF